MLVMLGFGNGLSTALSKKMSGMINNAAYLWVATSMPTRVQARATRLKHPRHRAARVTARDRDRRAEEPARGTVQATPRRGIAAPPCSQTRPTIRASTP